MSGKVSEAIKLLIIVAALAFVLGTLFKLMEFDDYNPVPVINLTPAAFHRAADTIFLFAIAVGAWFIVAMKEGAAGGGKSDGV